MKQPAHSQQKYRILIVDDEPDVLSSLVDFISNENYLIDAELDSRVALETIKTVTYDLILTDLMMPVVSGMDIVAAVKASGKDTLVIVVTGHATLNTAIESLQLGVYDYVRKPLQFSEIKSILNRAIDKIDLQKLNNELNDKNKRILKKLSFLIEVNKIMYQLTDFDTVMEMVMDTLDEYFEFSRCAFLKEDLKDDTYRVVQQIGFEKLKDTFRFSIGSYINHQKISTSGFTSVVVKNAQIRIDNQIIDFEPSLLFLLPLSFQGHIIGYILLSNNQNIEPDDETKTLLNVFLAQVAPAIHSLLASVSSRPDIEGDIVHLIRNQLNYARSVLSPVAFAIFRFEFYSPAGDLFSIRDMVDDIHKFVNVNIKAPALIKWQAQDTVLIIFPETDLFDVESMSVSLKQEILKKVSPKEPEAKINLIHACVSSAEKEETARNVIEKLWAKLIHEAQMVKNSKGLVHIN